MRDMGNLKRRRAQRVAREASALVGAAVAAVLCGLARADLLDEVCAADRAADAAVASIRTPSELAAKQAGWRAAWLKGLGGLPAEKTPLNAKEGPVVHAQGFRLQNVLFESQPGVFVVGHLFLPDATAFKPPYACVMMPLGHSDRGILNPRYADHLVRTVRAGLAAFAWDPLAQGERRQGEARFDATWGECACEHTRLGARGWLVGWNFARFHIWDAIRAVDYVLTRPEIDGTRLGVAGTSGGGTMSAYLQAWDARISAAFPNCYVSSLREVFGERGCHDAEQFYFGQLRDGVNHTAMLMLGQPRVKLAVGSRWKDYFPQRGAEETFAAFTNVAARLGLAGPFWHFHCDGPHGLPPATRAAQVDWMRHVLLGAEPPRPREAYWTFGVSDDPVQKAPLPFREADTFFTPTRQVRDLAGFRSVYALIAARARELARTRRPLTREELREAVRRRANIRPLDRLRREAGAQQTPFDHPKFGWWYLAGAYGHRRENEAAMLATLGRSAVGRDAENVILRSAAAVDARGGRPVALRAKGWDCIAAAHAFAAEPQLFDSIRLEEPPPSWTEMVTCPDPKDDSFAVGVWGALEEYDWTDLVPFARAD